MRAPQLGGNRYGVRIWLAWNITLLFQQWRGPKTLWHGACSKGVVGGGKRNRRSAGLQVLMELFCSITLNGQRYQQICDISLIVGLPLSFFSSTTHYSLTHLPTHTHSQTFLFICSSASCQHSFLRSLKSLFCSMSARYS